MFASKYSASTKSGSEGDLPLGLSRFQVQSIQERMFSWYRANRRELPWRDTADPYVVVVSEFMLQQTGVERVRPIFEAFMARFPTVQALADGSRLDVLRSWAGLGYNRRAVRLHDCARSIVRDHGGNVPDTLSELLKLTGVGPYTAAAILSFAFHQDVPTVDTNIRRIVERLFLLTGTTDRVIERAAQQLVPAGRSSEWNQALMDFGSLQCTVAVPACLVCPLSDICGSAPITTNHRPKRALAERVEPYLGSRRYLRGRLVAYLRSLDATNLRPIAEAVAAIGLKDTPGGSDLTTDIVRQLSDEGLARFVESNAVLFVGPPES